MRYDIHIDRPDGTPVSPSDWRIAVQLIEGLRLVSGPPAVSYFNGRERTAPSDSPYDAEVLQPDGQTPAGVILWSPSGRPYFRAPSDFADPQCHIRQVASKLAAKLGAELVGDEGETY